MTEPMKLYDLAGADEAARFSPYCWRIRMALAHKGLSVETVPWRFTEKEALAFSGQARVPVLVDGGHTVADSWAIAEYLEAAYKNHPSLFGGETGKALCRFVNHWVVTVLHPAIARIVLTDIHEIIHEKDKAYFRQSREAMQGKSLEAVGAEREANLAALGPVLKPLAFTLGQQAYMAGTAPDFADHIVFGAFQWARVASPIALVPADSPIAAWFGRMLDAYGGIGRAVPAAKAA